MKRTLFTIVLLLMLTLSGAHEFWLHPSRFLFNVGDKLLVNFLVGENFMGEPWDLKKHRIEKLELHQLTKSRSVADSVKEGKENLKITLREEGTHLLLMQSNNALIEMDGEKFNAYLKEDGLDEVLDQRQRTNTLSSAAKESYARYTKLLVQVGDRKDDTFKKVAGFPIEIIPEKNPYALKIGDAIRFKILFQGKPAEFGTKVKVWNRYDNRTTVQNIYTEKDGTMETRLSGKGPWMVSVVKMIPSKNADANWQSFWGSLVFGID